MARPPHPRASAIALIAALLLLSTAAPGWSQQATQTSKRICDVLHEPLPPEQLALSEQDDAWLIAGPTFTYRLAKATGAIQSLRVLRHQQEVVAPSGPADIQIDRYHLSCKENSVRVNVTRQGKDQVVFAVEALLVDPAHRGPRLDCRIVHTFFNDGVVVSQVTLVPSTDLPVQKEIVYRIALDGRFSHYLHKRRDEDGSHAVRGSLPEPGQAVRFNTLTSCLEVFSPAAAAAIFTDGGAIHVSRKDLDTAALQVTEKSNGQVQASLAQYLVHVAPGDSPYVLKAGEKFTFRVGISVAPNRLPHPRTHDLRMFTWIGDAKYPYPTDEEISGVAQLGFTLFQMHRAGTPGAPRPPAGEIDRVVKKVHESGMLLLWEENPDLLYAHAPAVKRLRAEGKWALWQGFNYGGRYTASMDPYCDLVATCLAAPNGQAEYRLENIARMMDQLPVDGLMLDDNLAYANCKLWKEHGHPRQVYDCLIELHEMNWRRRELMRNRCPHLVLVSHCTQGFILPVICDFDADLYGEGYSFRSLENYWDTFVAPVRSLHAQGMIWPGDSEDSRCGVATAFNLDLLSGGGQYNQIDWRVYAKKFPHAKGVTDREVVYARTYNLAQFYFGLYESFPCYSATSADLFTTTSPLSYATIYHNRVWGDWLIPVANMGRQPQTTSLEIRSPQTIGIAADQEYLLFDVHQRTVRTLPGSRVHEGLRELAIPAQSLRLFYLRQLPADAPCHLWGGKRITEVWDRGARKLTTAIDGPAGVQDELLIAAEKHGVQRVTVGGQAAPFQWDPAQRLVHGPVTFTAQPLTIEVYCSSDGANGLPDRPVTRGKLTIQ